MKATIDKDERRGDGVMHAAESHSMRSQRQALQGGGAGRHPAALHVLIVEDEMLPAMLLETAVTDAGHTARKAARLPKALELARTESFDAAVLDVNLAGEPVFPLAALLREQGVRFLFASGYGDAGVPPEYRDCTMLQKPYSVGEFRCALRVLLQDS